MGKAIGWKVALLRSQPRRSRGGSFEGSGGIWIEDLVKRVALLRSGHAGRVGSFAGFECRTLLRSRPRRSRGESFAGLASRVKVIEGGQKICWKIGIVTGGFEDLDQVVKAGLDTLITGEVDYPTEVKAKELGINLILGGHRETEIYGARSMAQVAELILQ